MKWYLKSSSTFTVRKHLNCTCLKEGFNGFVCSQGNIAEVSTLRSSLMNGEYVSVFT